MATIKKCKDCTEEKIIMKYGKCQKCYAYWLFNTQEGKEKQKKSIIRSKVKVAKDNKKALREKKRELNSSAAMKLADTYFSRFIRLKYSINGVCECYTCSEPVNIKECDNGHYMKREHKATRYEENNCRPQCKTCNGDTKHNGKQIEFRSHLIEKLRIEEVERIEQLSKSNIKADSFFYREKADHYREEVKKLEKELNVKYWK